MLHLVIRYRGSGLITGKGYCWENFCAISLSETKNLLTPSETFLSRSLNSEWAKIIVPKMLKLVHISRAHHFSF